MNATRRRLVMCHVNYLLRVRSLSPFFHLPISHQINGCNHHSLLPISISNAPFALSVFSLFTFFPLQTLHCCFPLQSLHLHHHHPLSVGFPKPKLSDVSRKGFSEHSAHAPSFQRFDYWLNQRLTQYTLFHFELQ